MTSIAVTPLNIDAKDEYVVQSARVSTLGAASADQKADKGLISYLMREKHASPFEHTHFKFRVHVPIFVAREFMRHRIASYNEESGRYKVLETNFYYPDDPTRPLIQIGKTGAYTFDEEDNPELREKVLATMDEAYGVAAEAYQKMLDMGIAKEVARMVLPVGIMTTFYVSMNARSLMNFLSLRTASNAQWEIRQVAYKMEKAFQEAMPLTHEAWVKFGRQSV